MTPNFRSADDVRLLHPEERFRLWPIDGSVVRRRSLANQARAARMAATATAAKVAASALVDDLARQDVTARVAVSLVAQPMAEFSMAIGPAR